MGVIRSVVRNGARNLADAIRSPLTFLRTVPGQVADFIRFIAVLPRTVWNRWGWS